MKNIKKEWVIVGFDHPQVSQSLIYKQRIRRTKTLLAALEEGINAGCNLFSIRGIEIPAPTVSAVSMGREARALLVRAETTETGTAAQKGQSQRQRLDE